ncbi:MAG: DUF1553 domain-containing protein, partial [Planctomycetes bacterium]|nr:DUF1553 domain-containing protein [Planctomycetota bacterium]
RFGDTSGYHMDSTRQMWLWRDWVIDAFNRNMPFNQFTIEQLAGDLLPNATVANRIASGFNRNTRFNEEGGVDPEEYVIRYNIDRTNTLGQAWLGLTLGCAECHSHKYDPITHREYYQLFAFFTGIKEPMISGPAAHGKPLPPLLRAPTAEQAKEIAGYRKTLTRVDEALAKQIAALGYVDPLAEKAIPRDIPGELIARSQLAWEATKAAHEKLPASVRDILRIDRAKRDDGQQRLLREFYLRKVNAIGREKLESLDQDADELNEKIRDVEAAMPHTLISEEMPNPRPAFVLIRGDFLTKGEKVDRGVPSAFGPMPKDVPLNRLGLARWLVRSDHPLTARVAVNRLWAQMFGHGIVRSVGDFGTQGEFPSHRELLDWLANEFVASGWNVKHMMRTIALSATYRQSSNFTPGAERVDPQNRLLARMPRFRLTAEEMRDSALASAGVLNRKIGGPSFMPYQPPDYYKNKNEDWPWSPSAGDDQYRRGLYAFWRRTALHPMFAILDAPNREECSVARPRTNTALQALVTLNDPTFMESARVLAQRVLTQGPRTDDDRLAFAFRSVTSRAPVAEELRVVRAQLKKHRDRYRLKTMEASSLVNVGQYPRDVTLDVSELAAWTALANVLLNLDEVLMRE